MDSAAATLSEAIETAIAKTLDQRLPAILANMQHPVVMTAKLDIILNKINSLDSRLSAMEATIAKASPPSNTVDHYSQGVQQATAEVMQEQVSEFANSVARLSGISDKMDAVLADTIDNLVWYINQAQQTQPAPQPQQVPSPTGSPSPSTQPPNASDVESLTEAIKSMAGRMETLEKLTASTIPEMVSKGLQQITASQRDFDAEVRASISAISGSTQDADLHSKLTDLEKKMETMPQMYIDSVALSLQRQTSSLLSVMDDLVKEQHEAITAAASRSSVSSPTTHAATANGTAGVSASRTIPAIPNMGIASRLSKLSSLVNRRSTPISPSDPEKPKAEILSADASGGLTAEPLEDAPALSS